MPKSNIEHYLYETDKNIFLTGPAGTGKTYVTNQFIANCEEKGLITCLCASTGIAALNIGGETVHKMFHIPVPCFEPPSFAKNKKGAITQAVLKTISLIDVLIVDEISMLTAPAFSFMMKVLHKAEKMKGKKIRVVVVGDLSQLPPVVTKEDEKLLKKFGFDKSGYCFTTSEWKNCSFKVVELTEVKRQDNREFIDNLNKVRAGSVTKPILNYFNSFVSEAPEDDDEYIYVCGTNAKTKAINEAYLDAFPGEYKVIKADKTGYINASYIDDQLLIKEGCRVIFTANDPKGQYKNGSFGVLEAVIPPDPDGEDEFHREGFCLVRIGEKKVWVQKKVYEANSYSCKGGSLVKKTVGTITQYPFKVGKAITIHKSQGQTFDKCIISPEIFASGQLYVALSRVRTPEGLILLSEIGAGDIIVDETVKKFVKAGYKWTASAPKKTTTTKKTTAKKTTSTKKTVTKKSAKKPATTKKSTPTKKKAVTPKKTTKKTTAKKAATVKKAPAKKVSKPAVKKPVKKDAKKTVTTK